jgi:hypothetical protein
MTDITRVQESGKVTFILGAIAFLGAVLTRVHKCRIFRHKFSVIDFFYHVLHDMTPDDVVKEITKQN